MMRKKKKWDKKNPQSHSKAKLLTKIKNNKKTVAALAATGTLAIVAVSAATFGNVQQTLDNIPLFGGGDQGLDMKAMENCCSGGGCEHLCSHGCVDCAHWNVM